tara:strand:+ start:121 stop:504 length:384 start_codon:yes stop_codon:yes gene_type:complete
MDESNKELIKPDISSPLKKRDSYLSVSEDDMTLVTVDLAEDCKIQTDGGIKDGVKITCRVVDTKNYLDKDGVKRFTYHPQEEIKLKEAYSTSTFYLLKDFKTASHWPKEGIMYWVWKASDGLRWEKA